MCCSINFSVFSELVAVAVHSFCNLFVLVVVFVLCFYCGCALVGSHRSDSCRPSTICQLRIQSAMGGASLLPVGLRRGCNFIFHLLRTLAPGALSHSFFTLTLSTMHASELPFPLHLVALARILITAVVRLLVYAGSVRIDWLTIARPRVFNILSTALACACDQKLYSPRTGFVFF